MCNGSNQIYQTSGALARARLLTLAVALLGRAVAAGELALTLSMTNSSPRTWILG